MFIRSLGLRLGRPYTKYEVHLGKQQRIQSQVQHDLTDDDIPEVICGAWLKLFTSGHSKGVRSPKSPLATGMYNHAVLTRANNFFAALL